MQFAGDPSQPLIQRWIFYGGYACLMTHELDAIDKAEWRIFPGLSLLPDDLGFLLFTLAHIPLVAILLAGIAHQNPVVRDRTRVGLSAFLVVHAGLHKLFEHHPDYRFTTPLSIGLIYGGAVMGLLYLVCFVRWHGAQPSDQSRE